MTSLAIAGVFGLVAVILYIASGLLTIAPRRLPSLAPVIAVVALTATVIMVIAALLGLLQLVVGAFS